MGPLHLGGARTALFNWLYARQHGGTFVLRIDDAEAGHPPAEMLGGILHGLKWLGLDWDEGPHVGGPHAPYFQSGRLDRYRRAAGRLVASGHAYHCYCRPDDLKARRDAAGGAWMYDGTCRNLSHEEVQRRESSGRPRALRFRVPDDHIAFDDLVHGTVQVESANVEDFVILRSDGHPTYHLAAVVDDIDMEITHVVRGDDQISNTPKHVLLYDALGAAMPLFAHVPLILGPDRQPLGPRHDAASVAEYEAQGYLPDAMVNGLALLGWSPRDDREIFSRDDLVREFSLESISRSPAIFNLEKLDWFNHQHLMRLPAEAILGRLRPALESIGLTRGAFQPGERARLERAIDLVKPRARKLVDLIELLRPFIADAIEHAPEALAMHLSDRELLPHLAAWRAKLENVAPFDAETIEWTMRQLAEARRVKAASLIHATRVAITGHAVSSGVFEILEVLGRERAVARIAAAERLLAGGLR